MNRPAGYAAVILGTLALLAGLWHLRSIVILLLFSVFVAAAVRPIIARLVRFRIAPTGAQVIVFAAVLAAAGAFFAAFNFRIATDLLELNTRLQGKYWALYLEWLQGNPAQQALISQAPPPIAVGSVFTADDGRLATLFTVTQSLVETAGGLLLVLILSIYWSGDQAHFERLWLSLLAPARRARARIIWRDIEEAIGRYLLGEALQSGLALLVLGTLFFLAGIRYGITQALIVALLLLVPLVGELLAVLTTLLIGLLADPVTGLVSGGLTLALLLGLKIWLEPHLIHQRGSALLTVLAAVFFLSAFGFWGLLLAPPFALAGQLLLHRLVDRAVPAGRRAPAAGLPHLRDRLSGVRRRLVADGSPAAPSPEIGSLVERLERLLGEMAALPSTDPAGGEPLSDPGAGGGR